jgi:hypothetical protein
VPERELAAAARRHADGGMPKPPAELVDRLTDHFLHVVPPTSVTWVHPSWRDLLVERLAADAQARRSFLAHCSVEGVVLALSTGGGATGGRTLPLLVDDADWDTVAARQHELLPELDDDGAARILRSLEEARGTADAELDALTAETLDVLRRQWDAGRRHIRAALLEPWLELRAQVNDPPPLPDMTQAWEELLPADAPDLRSPAELLAFDEWLRFGGVLGGLAPEAQETVGFPDAYGDVLERFVTDARRLLDQPQLPPTAGLVASVLRRAEEVAPSIASDAGGVARLLVTDEDPVLAWDDPVPLAAGPPQAATSVVRRILADL